MDNHEKLAKGGFPLMSDAVRSKVAEMVNAKVEELKVSCPGVKPCTAVGLGFKEKNEICIGCKVDMVRIGSQYYNECEKFYKEVVELITKLTEEESSENQDNTLPEDKSGDESDAGGGDDEQEGGDKAMVTKKKTTKKKAAKKTTVKKTAVKKTTKAAPVKKVSVDGKTLVGKTMTYTKTNAKVKVLSVAKNTDGKGVHVEFSDGKKKGVSVNSLK